MFTTSQFQMTQLQAQVQAQLNDISRKLSAPVGGGGGGGGGSGSGGGDGGGARTDLAHKTLMALVKDLVNSKVLPTPVRMC